MRWSKLFFAAITLGILGCHSLNKDKSKGTITSDTARIANKADSSNAFKLHDSSSPSITDLFLKLPLDISLTARDSLLKYDVYIVPPIKAQGYQRMKFKIDSISSGYLRYEGGIDHDRTRHFFELKRFRKTDGNFILVFSSYGTFLDECSQDELKIYAVTGNAITENKDSLLPVTINPVVFANGNMPDSILYQWQADLINLRYHLGGNGFNDKVSPNEVKFIIDYINDDDTSPYIKWLKYSGIVFTWNGNSFSKRMIPAKQ